MPEDLYNKAKGSKYMNYLLIYERRECYEDPEERGKMREKERQDAMRLTHGLP